MEEKSTWSDLSRDCSVLNVDMTKFTFLNTFIFCHLTIRL